jgi:hypothetical protein
VRSLDNRRGSESQSDFSLTQFFGLRANCTSLAVRWPQLPRVCDATLALSLRAGSPSKARDGVLDWRIANLAPDLSGLSGSKEHMDMKRNRQVRNVRCLESLLRLHPCEHSYDVTAELRQVSIHVLHEVPHAPVGREFIQIADSSCWHEPGT